ncbi:hypothetical protein E2C01_071666 [Portunus trituberculatus]|uniref:Uncharacterized protein n=1 Tax=Portunus trituberculatus TaxID=210409 RepID=A0A5B7I8L2_PORTR|nr:hypothetical protein [Portunus trituberculatus]
MASHDYTSPSCSKSFFSVMHVILSLGFLWVAATVVVVVVEVMVVVIGWAVTQMGLHNAFRSVSQLSVI